MGKVIGIDLGTTNSVACIIELGEPRIVINAEGARLTPSVVGFSKDGERLVGEIAKRQLLMYPEETIHSIKRFIGRDYQEAKIDIDRVAFNVKPEGDSLTIPVGDKSFTPQQLSAFVLQKVKKSAEDFLGHPITEAVITVPAYFNNKQRQATKDAGEIAGLDVLRIINEPTAAALAYTVRRTTPSTIAVYDFGGGTFDISILDVDKDIAEVRATAGNNHLGGTDIDARLVDWLIDEFKKSSGIDVSRDRIVRQRLLEAAEKAKIDLSSSMESEIHLPFLAADDSGPKHLQVLLTRATLEFLVDDIIQKTITECEKALKEAKIDPSEIDEILLVGGSSRIPRVQELIKKLFNRPLNKRFNPDEVVAIGAALQAGMLSGTVTDVTLLDVTNFSLGIETTGKKYARLIPKGSTVPVVRSQMVSTVIDNQKSVRIHVLQGESLLAADNISLGDFELNKIQPAPRGMPRIKVSFTIDTDGIVSVTAREVSTGATQSITIHSRASMASVEIEQAMDELDGFDRADEAKEEVEDIRQTVERQLYSMENFLRDNKPKLKKRAITDTEQALKRGRMALVKQADNSSLEALSQYLSSYQDHLESEVSDEKDETGVSIY
jgi:molecular chaperone DnaK